MKKYSKPNIEVTLLSVSAGILAGSVEAQVDDENTQSNEDALSRKSNGYSLWDDDYEE